MVCVSVSDVLSTSASFFMLIRKFLKLYLLFIVSHPVRVGGGAALGGHQTYCLRNPFQVSVI